MVGNGDSKTTKTKSAPKADKNKAQVVSEPTTQQIELDVEHLESIMRHVDNVRASCLTLARRLSKDGEFKFALSLVKSGLVHDQSKLSGIEWEYLRQSDDADEKLKLAHQQHISTNAHHPEFWDSINEMPAVCVAEMVCDWRARSSEAGTDLRQWIKDVACQKYGMSLQGKAYKLVKRFVDLLLDKPLTRVLE